MTTCDSGCWDAAKPGNPGDGAHARRQARRASGLGEKMGADTWGQRERRWLSGGLATGARSMRQWLWPD
jgi:hypothetical protein